MRRAGYEYTQLSRFAGSKIRLSITARLARYILVLVLVLVFVVGLQSFVEQWVVSRRANNVVKMRCHKTQVGDIVSERSKATLGSSPPYTP